MGRYSVEVFFRMDKHWKVREEKTFDTAYHYDADCLQTGEKFGERTIEFSVRSKQVAYDFVKDLSRHGIDAQMSRLDNYETVQE